MILTYQGQGHVMECVVWFNYFKEPYVQSKKNLIEFKVTDDGNV